MIGHRHDFIFVHIPKTAGQSLVKALRPHALYPHQRIVQRIARHIWRHSKFDAYNIMPGHWTAREYRDTLGPDDYARRYSFAVVRNPWDRELSFYSFAKKNTKSGLNPIANKYSFAEFVEYLSDHRPVSQASFVTDETGTVMVDRIARFERLETDFAEICKRIGISAKLGHKNKSSRPPYQQAYSDRTREIIADIFAEDIDRFSYSFGD